MTEHDVRNNISEFGDDREMQRLVKMASALATDNMKRKDSKPPTSLVLDNISKTIDDLPQKLDHITHVEPVTKVAPNTATAVTETNTGETSNKLVAPDSTHDVTDATGVTGVQLFNIFGFAFPKSTLYFILVAIAIAVILYYWTSPSHSLSTEREDDDTE